MANVEALISEAQALERAGGFGEAETLYRRALELIPESGEIYFMLGCMFVRSGRPADGLPVLEEAARLLPNFAEAQIVLGNVLISLGRWDHAVLALTRAVALRPDILPVRANLALALCSSGRPEEAESLYREFLEADPDNEDAHRNLAHVLNERHRFAEAEAHARAAVDPAPGNALALNVLCNTLLGLGELAEAVEVCQRAIAVDPDLPQARLNLYVAYRDQGLRVEAEQAARDALRLLPNSPHVLDAAGRALMELDRWNEAIELLERASRIEPNSEVILQRLAYAHSRNGALEKAVELGAKAVHLAPSAGARFALALDQLRTGRYREGWKNLPAIEEVTRRPSPYPKWDGSALNGRTLNVYAEAGLGDTLMFARFLPMALERARGDVIFQCQPGLAALLADLPGVAEIVPLTGAPRSADCYIGMMSLPGLLDITEETIPSGLLPLRVHEQVAELWRERLNGMSGVKVGICWSCGGTWEGRYRSIPLERFAPLFEAPNVNFISLQIGPPTEELGSSRSSPDILHAPDDISTLAKTAALMRELDLVISVDTSIAHLGGALGVETWIPIHYTPSPWWNVNRPNDTPWYPRHRLFRQPRVDDWESVIERIRVELVARASAACDIALTFAPAESTENVRPSQ